MRFESTLQELGDCLEHIEDDLEGREAECRLELMVTCREVLESLQVPIDSSEFNEAYEDLQD